MTSSRSKVALAVMHVLALTSVLGLTIGAPAGRAASFPVLRPIAGPPIADGACAGVTADGALMAWATDGEPSRLEVTRLTRNGADRPLEPSGQGSFSCPLVAADGALGAVMAVSDGPASVVVREADGRLATPVRFGANAETGSVAVSGGRIAAAWLESGAHDELTPMLAVRGPDGAWSAPRPLGPAIAYGGDPGYDAGPMVGLDASGHGIAAWHAGKGAVQAATFAPDGTPDSPRTLSAPRTEDPFELQLAVNGRGQAAVAWPERSGTRIATGTTTAGLDVAHAITAPTGNVTIAPSGAAVVVHEAIGESAVTLRVSSRAPAGEFTAPRRYRLAGADAEESAAVALAPDGRALLVAFYPDPKTYLYRLGAVQWRAGQRPSRLAQLPAASTDITEVHPMIDANGAAILVNDRPHLSRPGTDDPTYLPTRMLTARVPRHPRARAARATVTVAPRQTLGHRGTIRLRVRCARACRVRIVGVGSAGAGIETATDAPAGRTMTIAAPFDDADEQLPRAGWHEHLAIGIDDNRGGQLILKRTIRLQP